MLPCRLTARDRLQWPGLFFYCLCMSNQDRCSADAFSMLMQSQASVASNISPIIISSNGDGGSPSDSISNDKCPDFSAQYVVRPNATTKASKKNPSVEMHFVISKRIISGTKNTGCSATCAFCGSVFTNTNITKMRMHLTGEKGETTRPAGCLQDLLLGIQHVEFQDFLHTLDVDEELSDQD